MPDERTVVTTKGARTLDELAELAGVSRATVSRVINGGPVAEATRVRVRAVIDEVGYRPNLAARGLASGRTGVVGLVMHAPAPAVFRDPYFSELLQGIAESLSDQAAGLMLWLADDSREEMLGKIMSSRFADGIIATATMLDDPLVDGLLTADMPTVLVGHRRDDLTANFVDIDNEAAAARVVDHLLGRGRRRVGHITGARGTVSGEDRLAGYLRALGCAGIGEALVVDGDYSVEAGYAGARQLVESGVDAVFAGSDLTAMGVYEALGELGMAVPGDVAVAGFDDLDVAARMDPPLTTVRQNVREQGECAARTLLALLEHPDGAPQRIILPTELVVRASTGG